MRGRHIDKTARLRGAAYGTAVVALVAAWILWAGMSKQHWSLLGVSQMEGWFDDWVAVLAAAETWAKGGDPWHIPHLADPYGRPHVYGPGWFTLGIAGFGVKDVLWQGWIVVLGFVCFAVLLFRVRDVLSCALALLVLLSFPVMLGINRANNDLVVLMMIGVAAWMNGRREPAADWLAATLVAAASLLKFYPVVAVVALFARPVLDRGHWVRWASVATVAAVATWAQWEEVSRSLRVVPRAFTSVSYDARHSLQLLNADVLGPVFFLGSLVGVALVGVLTATCARSWWRLIPTSGSEAFLVVASTTVWCACLFAGASFAYRAVWLTPLIACLWSARGQATGKLVWTLAFLLLFLWCGSAKAILRIQLGPQSSLLVRRAFQFVCGIEHPLVIGTLLLGIVILLGWLTRRFIELRPTNKAALAGRV